MHACGADVVCPLPHLVSMMSYPGATISHSKHSRISARGQGPVSNLLGRLDLQFAAFVHVLYLLESQWSVT